MEYPIAYKYNNSVHCLLCTAKHFKIGFTFSPGIGIYFSDKIKQLKDKHGKLLTPVMEPQVSIFINCRDCKKIYIKQDKVNQSYFKKLKQLKESQQ